MREPALGILGFDRRIGPGLGLGVWGLRSGASPSRLEGHGLLATPSFKALPTAGPPGWGARSRSGADLHPRTVDRESRPPTPNPKPLTAIKETGIRSSWLGTSWRIEGEWIAREVMHPGPPTAMAPARAGRASDRLARLRPPDGPPVREVPQPRATGACGTDSGTFPEDGGSRRVLREIPLSFHPKGITK